MVLSDRFPPGTVIGNDFEIVRPLSQDGMGTVYVAIQRATGAPRALKLMRRALLGDVTLRRLMVDTEDQSLLDAHPSEVLPSKQASFSGTKAPFSRIKVL